MKDRSAATKILGGLDDGEVRLFKFSRERFHLEFERGTPDTYMKNSLWLSRCQLRIVSDLLLEALGEDDDD